LKTVFLDAGTIFNDSSLRRMKMLQKLGIQHGRKKEKKEDQGCRKEKTRCL